MRLHLHRLLARRRFSALILAAVLGLSIVGLSQCRMVDNSVTGVDIKSSGVFSSDRAACEKECNNQFKRCRSEAEQRHRINKRHCDELPNPARAECKKSESRRYKDEVKACEEGKKQCKKACRYQEGSVLGGR